MNCSLLIWPTVTTSQVLTIICFSFRNINYLRWLSRQAVEHRVEVCRVDWDNCNKRRGRRGRRVQPINYCSGWNVTPVQPSPVQLSPGHSNSHGFHPERMRDAATDIKALSRLQQLLLRLIRHCLWDGMTGHSPVFTPPPPPPPPPHLHHHHNQEI